jgi:potassium efflux system protein
MRLSTAVVGLVLMLAPVAASAANPAATSAASPPAAAPAPVAPPAAAPAPAASATPASATVDWSADQQALDQLQTGLQTTSADTKLAALGAKAAAITARAKTVEMARNADLTQINAALKPLTPRGKRAPTASAAAKMAPLLAQRTVVLGELHQAQAVASAASSTFNQIAERRREGFSARVLQRSDSPLAPQFWTSLAQAADADYARLYDVASDAIDTAVGADEPRGLGGLAIGLALALALVVPVRHWLERLGRRRIASDEPARLAKTAAAVWIAFVDIASVAAAMVALRLSAQWSGLLTDKADALASAAVVAATWATAIQALGRVLAADKQSRWRLVSLPDDTAGPIRVLLIAVSVVTGGGFLLTRLNYVVGASVAATIASNCVLALAYSAVAGLVMIRFGRSRAPTADTAAKAAERVAAAAPSPIWTLVSLALGCAIAVTVGAVFAGYTTLAALISGQIFWLSVIAAVTYLLLRLVDDACAALFAEHGWAARSLFLLFYLRQSTIGQIGVLISAGLQLLIVVGALSLALTPFGRSGDMLLGHFSQLGGAIHLGTAIISPEAIITGLITLAVGITLVRVVQGWIVRRYLPVTDWDAGVRNSVSTGVGYLGVGVAAICALTAMGLGFQQIALIASALSVGIGFGLQQIVQNFVSGIILLVERPVKVGDWINVGGVEGDVRRIRVRATEIQTFDRTTVIVPNSDLISKQVQNKTLGDPRGRILLQISIANPADAAMAKTLVEQIAKDEKRVLANPAPQVFIDSLAAGGGVNFNCYLYVASQRDVYAVRSALYFKLLEVFPREGVAFIGASGPTSVVVEPGPELRAMLDGMGKPPSKDA